MYDAGPGAVAVLGLRNSNLPSATPTSKPISRRGR